MPLVLISYASIRRGPLVESVLDVGDVMHYVENLPSDTGSFAGTFSSQWQTSILYIYRQHSATAARA